MPILGTVASSFFDPGTRGVFGGGANASADMTYVTIATTGTAASFGSLTSGRRYLNGCASSTRGVFSSGYQVDVLDYITIATTGNATSFGDSISVSYGAGGLSNGHGGLA